MRNIIYHFLSFFIVVSFTSCFFQPSKKFNPEISADDLRNYIGFLASDELKGRMSGSPEAEQAANYIRNIFRECGLKSFDGQDYFQRFSFIADVIKGSNNSLSFPNAIGKRFILLEQEYTPLSFSASGQFSGELVFAGYGISAPKLHWDDYEGLDVKGKFVIALRFNPEFDKPRSEFEEFSSFRYKANLAKEKGALGIIFINGNMPGLEEDKLAEFKYDRAASMKEFAVIQIKRDLADQLFAMNETSTKALQDSMKSVMKPISFAMKNSDMSLSVDISLLEKTSINVVGYLDGNDPAKKNEYLVIGAHYDHLGMGSEGSLYRGNDPQVHNGADDNASGTAGVLELAQKISSEKKNDRPIIFTAFSGEELGLLGSDHFVNHPPVPANEMVTMLNLDMIGRLSPDKNLIVYGTGTSSIWKKLVDSLNKPYAFKITKNDEGYGPSDQTSFYSKSIPVLFFFTGIHADYHRPTDDADKINYSGEDSVLHFVHDIAASIYSNPAKPDYINVPRKPGDRSGGWRVYVGTIPDFAYQGDGFKISGASEGGPAQKAGLKAGDIILKFGSTPVGNIYDFTNALKNYVPGDLVVIKVKRGEEIININVELGAR